MAVERRVKPSERARQVIAEKRKWVIIGVIALIVLIAGIVAAIKIVPAIIYDEPLPWEKTSGEVGSGKKDKANQDAIKAMLEKTVSYDGTWYEDEQIGFQAYVPGTEKYTYDGQVSEILFKNPGGTAVYGVVTGPSLPTLDNDATNDTQAVLDATAGRIIPDISSALYGANFNAAYDVSVTTLGDKTPAIYVTGEMATKMSLKAEGASTAETITYDYPLCGIAFVRNDIPVMVWGVADSDDTGAARNLPTYLSECATIMSNITADNTNAEEG